MGAVDRTEKALRKMHILFSKAPSFDASGQKIVVDKSTVIDELRELKQCMYDMMGEYELTVQSRQKADLKIRRENEQRIYEANKRAEDIYAASIMYTERSLTELQDVMRLIRDNMELMYSDFEERMKNELQQVKTNELELKSQLEGLMDNEMYTRLIDEANRKREKEKQQEQDEPPEPGPYTHVKADIRVNEELIEAIGGGDAPPPLEEKNYADIVPEIKINEAYFEKKGIEMPELPPKTDPASPSGEKALWNEIDIDTIGADVIAETLSSESIADGHGDTQKEERLTQDISDEELAEISANLDAEYFDWKKEAEEELKAEENRRKHK
ncbi:MAG: hypothetical protein IJT32_04185 [Lachnospiraceae bacterium]|nr:hypothetical protein [Lachnospiraceae bacterium]